MGWSTGTCDQVWSKSVKSCRRYKTLIEVLTEEEEEEEERNHTEEIHSRRLRLCKKKKKKKKKEIIQMKYTVAECDCVRTRHIAVTDGVPCRL